MLKNMLKATVFATTLALGTGAVSMPAFAEVVYNRGSAAEPRGRPVATGAPADRPVPAAPHRRKRGLDAGDCAHRTAPAARS